MSLCSDEEIAGLLELASENVPDQLERIELALTSYPSDPRLHFLRGSILAQTGRPIEAHAALSRAVGLAPDFAVARFQLGFFELTSGEAARAIETLLPLDGLPDEHYLRLFGDGLRCLIADRFTDTIDRLSRGIAANDENLPLNRDMQLIVDRCRPIEDTTAGRPAPTPAAAAEEETSATAFLLGQLGGHKTIQ